jgi:hypothetical protein
MRLLGVGQRRRQGWREQDGEEEEEGETHLAVCPPCKALLVRLLCPPCGLRDDPPINHTG